MVFRSAQRRSSHVEIAVFLPNRNYCLRPSNISGVESLLYRALRAGVPLIVEDLVAVLALWGSIAKKLIIDVIYRQDLLVLGDYNHHIHYTV